MHLLKRARGDEPVVQRKAADSERGVETLVAARTEAVERDREAVDSELGHDHGPFYP